MVVFSDLEGPLKELLEAKGGWEEDDVALCGFAGKEDVELAREELKSGRNALDVWEEVKMGMKKREERKKKKEERAEMLRRQQEETLTSSVATENLTPEDSEDPFSCDAHPLRTAPTLQSPDPASHYWDPLCPSCNTSYPTPPKEWVCPNSRCNHAKVWQPDKGPKSVYCANCIGKLSFMNRHHCRNCGRMVCSQCLGREKVMVPRAQYLYIQKVCLECFGIAQDAGVVAEGGVTRISV